MDKKILVVSQRYWPEDRKITDICEGLAAKGYETDVICGKPNYPAGKYYPGYTALKPKEEVHEDVRLHRTWEIARGSGTHLEILLNYFSFSVSSYLKACRFRKNEYEAVLVFLSSSIGAARSGLHLGKRMGAPVTFIIDDLWPQSFFREMDIQNGFLRRIFRSRTFKFYRRADHLAAKSEKIKEYLINEADIPGTKVSCIPSCPEKYLEKEVMDITLMEKYAGSFNVSFCGGLEKECDPETLLEAAQMFKNRGIRDIRFIFFGKGSLFEKMKKKTDSYGLGDLVYFEEKTERRDLGRFLFISDVIICTRVPDDSDMFKTPADAADLMTAGRPMIAASGSPEALEIKKAGCGYSCGAGNAQELFDVLLRLYSMPDRELEALGKNAKNYQQQNYNRERALDELISVMNGSTAGAEKEQQSGLIRF